MSAYLSDEQAIQIWKEKWASVPIQTLTQKYRVNPFRIYEVFTEQRNPGTRIKAFEQFKKENPSLATRIDPSPHTPKRMVVPRPLSDPNQISLF